MSFWDRYAAFIERRHPAILAGAALLTAAGLVVASGLALRSDFGELLPRNAPSLRVLDGIRERTEGLSTLVVGIEGGDWKARQAFVESAAAALEARLPDRVSQVEYTMAPARRFFEANKYLYMDLPDLATLRERLGRKVEDTRRRRLVVDLDDTPPYRFDVDDLERKYRDKVTEHHKFPDDYFITPDRTLQILMLRIGGAGMAEESTEDLVRDVRATLAELHPDTHGFRVLIGGNPVVAMEERQGVVEDVVAVSIACIVLVILSVILYYRSVVSLLVIGAPVLVGTALAFGVAEIAIGSLNSNTAFLGSIIVGNGINFPIILLARYIEERRRGAEMGPGLRTALRGTWSGTAAAASAAAIAYGSLMATDFRGFSQFGFIGSVGILLCWGATFIVAPALCVALGRRWPTQRPAPRVRASVTSGLESFFRRRGRLVTALGLGVATASLVAAALFYRDPFEYDFSRLRSRRAADSESTASSLGRRVDSIFAGTKFQGEGRTVILADRPDQVPMLVEAIRHKTREARIPVDVASLQDLIPADQETKLAVLADIRQLLDRKVLGWMSPEERCKVEEHRPRDGLHVIGPEDLPPMLLRPFREKDGTIGRIAYVDAHINAFEGRRLIRYAGLIRRLDLPNGDVIQGSGYHVILADILTTILEDGPVATAASLAGVLLVVLAAFRRLRDRSVVLAALLVGVAWMCGVAVVLGVKINMLNFVALPITFGIGVDYGVNFYRRYLQEGAGGLGRALWTTGSAVALCSLTTIIGYGSLLFADTRALSSFGLVAVVGEVTTLAAALLWLPALLALLARGRR